MGGGDVSFEIMWTDPRHESFLQDRSGPWEECTKTGVVHGRRAPRQEWSMGGVHQDRSGPWEECTKTGVVHGRSAPRQEWSMGGEHQDRSGPWEECTKTGVVHGREHQDRSGPWEECTKTGVVHGRRAPRQEWSMGGEHQDSRTEGRRAEGPLH